MESLSLYIFSQFTGNRRKVLPELSSFLLHAPLADHSSALHLAKFNPRIRQIEYLL